MRGAAASPDSDSTKFFVSNRRQFPLLANRDITATGRLFADGRSVMS